MSLVRTSLLNAVAVAVKVGAAMVLNKILAVYVGPAGYAAIGQFQNVISMALSVAGGVIGPGVTKGTAEHFDSLEKQHSVWQTAVRLTLGGAALAGLILLCAAPWLSVLLLQRSDMTRVFVGLGLALPAIAINNLLLAILNGKKDIRVFVSANIVGSLLSLVLVGMLTYMWGLHGALLGIAITPAAALFATAGLAGLRPWFKMKYLWGKIDSHAMRELSGFGMMGLTAAVTAPLSYIYIRDFMSHTLGLNAAGYWQASWKISEIYLMLVTLTLSVYYLPRIAEIKRAGELRIEILKVYKFVLPLLIAGAILIFLLRDFLIQKLFSADFSPMRDLFKWQLIGDTLKIGSWILSYILLGRAMVKAFIATEVFFSISFCVATHFLVLQYGLIGVSMAYALNYLFYWITMAFLVRHEMNEMEKRDVEN